MLGAALQAPGALPSGVRFSFLCARPLPHALRMLPGTSLLTGPGKKLWPSQEAWASGAKRGLSSSATAFFSLSSPPGSTVGLGSSFPAGMLCGQCPGPLQLKMVHSLPW